MPRVLYHRRCRQKLPIFVGRQFRRQECYILAECLFHPAQSDIHSIGHTRLFMTRLEESV